MTSQRNPNSRNTAAGGTNRRPRPAAAPDRRGPSQRPAQRNPRQGAPGTGTATRRPAGAPQGGRPYPGPVRSQPRGWRRVPARVRLTIFVAVVALAVFGVVWLVRHPRDNAERFVDNVYVNGVCLTGYTQEEGYALIRQMRDERLNATYSLTFGDRSWSFTPADFGAKMDCDSELERAWNLGHVGDRATRRQIIDNLKEIPAEFNSALTYDHAALSGYIGDIAAEIDTEPVDAEVTLGVDKPVITRASRNGLRLNRDQTEQNLVALLETGAGDTRLPVEEIQPTITSDNMEMKVVAKVSTDVSFRNRASRENVGLALGYFNGFQVNPGDSVSFNEIVGPRTKERGFQEAPEYAGNETTTGFGGGVCQASTTLYDAVIMADLTILERHSHSMTVQYVDPSQDAAVEYGTDGKDFIFRNDTEHSYYIYTDVDKDFATVTIYGTRPEYHYELVSVIVNEQPSDRIRYEYDYDGRYAYLTTDTQLKEEGHGSCESEGWLVAYDWDTKAEISRELINHDMYRPGVNVYWRGVHDADGNVVIEE